MASEATVLEETSKTLVTEQKENDAKITEALARVPPIPAAQQKLLQMCYGLLKQQKNMMNPKIISETLSACRKLRVQDTHELLKFIVPRTFMVYHQLTRNQLDTHLSQKQNNVDILSKQVEADRASPTQKAEAEKKLHTAERVLSQYYANYHKAVKTAETTERDDLDLSWRLLLSLIETSKSEKGKLDACRCMVQIAERVKDVQKLKEAMDLYIGFTKENAFQDVIKQFMTLPLMGAWKTQTDLIPNLVKSSLETQKQTKEKTIKQIDDQLKKLNTQKEQLETSLKEVTEKLDQNEIDNTKELEVIMKDMASTAERSDKILNYHILYDLMKIEGLDSADMDTESLDWEELTPKELKIKFKDVAIDGFPEKEKQQREEIESSGKGSSAWDVLPNPQGFIVKRMGAVVQVVNITENFNLVGVDIDGRRIHCKGVTRDILEKESHAKKVKEQSQRGEVQKEKPMFTPVKVGNQQVLMFDPQQAHVVKIFEEWDINIDDSKPAIWRGVLTHISEPQLPKGTTERNEDSAIVKTVFDFEMELERAFSQRAYRKKVEAVKSGVDGLTLD